LVSDACAVVEEFFLRSSYDVYRVTCPAQMGECLVTGDELTCSRIVTSGPLPSTLPAEFSLPVDALDKYLIISESLYVQLRLHVAVAAAPPTSVVAAVTPLASAATGITSMTADQAMGAMVSVVQGMQAIVSQSLSLSSRPAPERTTNANILFKRDADAVGQLYYKRPDFVRTFTTCTPGTTSDIPANSYAPGEASARIGDNLKHPTSDLNRPTHTPARLLAFAHLKFDAVNTIADLKLKGSTVELNTLVHLIVELKKALADMGPPMLAALDTFMANITQFLIENKSMTCVDSMVSLINSVLDDLRKIEVFNLDIMAPDRFPTIAVDNCLSLSTARPVVQRFLAAAAEKDRLRTQALLHNLQMAKNPLSKRGIPSNNLSGNPPKKSAGNRRGPVSSLGSTAIDWLSKPLLGNPAADHRDVCIDWTLKRRLCTSAGPCPRSSRNSAAPKLHAWPTGTTAQQKKAFTDWGEAQPGLN
jgi:hypothetical protein